MVDIQEKLEQGYIQSKVIIELAGKPKEYIEKTIKQYLELIKKNADLKVLKEDLGETKEIEGEENKGLWITFIELELLAKDIPTLTGFCFDYMPSSIEIIAPAELKIKDRQFTSIMNDLQGKLHKLDMGAKQLNNENKFLKKNAYFLATNLVSVLLKTGAKTLKDLSRLSGMVEKDMNEFLEKLIKQEFVKKEGEEYKWIKSDKREE
ncbi:hypothetical protein GOV06_00540 [Candidatus Woesearchaeota archaeon]|nr:hypothetical protein [Candidatus Woesearchaeota archaeon]